MISSFYPLSMACSGSDPTPLPPATGRSSAQVVPERYILSQSCSYLRGEEREIYSKYELYDDQESFVRWSKTKAYGVRGTKEYGWRTSLSLPEMGLVTSRYNDLLHIFQMYFRAKLLCVFFSSLSGFITVPIISIIYV